MGKKTDLESVHLMNHSKCMLAAFQNFRQDETMLDATLVCNGMSIKAHKLVLSACSPLLKEIFSENPCEHPVIILQNFEFADLKAIIEFIYKGELSVPRERLMLALKVAEELQIRGLRRSEPNREKYEKLYNQVCGKLSSRKKRKRHRHNSSDSECVSIPDSDQNVVESDETSSAHEEIPVESQQSMEVEAVETQNISSDDKIVRPVVLRVGDPVARSVENIDENECNLISSAEMKSMSDGDSLIEHSTSLLEDIANQSYVEPVSESVATTSFNAYDASATTSNVSVECVPTVEQNNSLAEESAEPMSITEYSGEQDGLISSSCLSPKSADKVLEDEGKRFVCGKCNDAFPSRISFMRHKASGHHKVGEKRVYECKQCDFTTEELDYFKDHTHVHSDKVPYKCNSCPEEFTSEELYNEHLSLHKEEKDSLPGLSSARDLFPMQNRNPEKYNCSICFKKFLSKLSCQFHEKTCQGPS